MTTPKFEVGDRVAYTAAFLRSTGQVAGDMGHLRGVVARVDRLGDNDLVTIEWTGRGTGRAIARNLAIVGPNTRFCAC